MVLKMKLFTFMNKVFILEYLDYYMNTSGDMQNEKYFYDHYKKFEYNHDYVKLMKHCYTITFKYVCILNIITCICVRVFFRNVDKYILYLLQTTHFNISISPLFS